MRARAAAALVGMVFCATALAARPGEVVRPGEQGASDALGEGGACEPSALAGESSPFIADWGDAARADLESAMRGGVAVVSYTCDGIKVLSGCTVDGRYDYVGISPKTRIVEMRDAASMRANFGGLPSLPARMSAELSQGRSLNLAYMMVGTQSSPVTGVPASGLEGRCAGATHIVNRAYIGAFVMDTAAEGAARAAVDVLGVGGASGAASSASSSHVADGSVAMCQRADLNASSSPGGCAAMLRVNLVPVGGSAAIGAGAVDGRGCPDGFVYADERCVRPSEVPYFLCDKDDPIQCKEQCEAGSLESCGRYGAHILSTYVDPADLIIGVGSGSDIKADLRGLVEKMNDACEAGEANACTVSGLAVPIHGNGGIYAEGYEVDEYLQYMTRGCEGGDSYGCISVMDAYGLGLYTDEDLFSVDVDVEKMDQITGRACRQGATRSCVSLAEMLSFNHANTDVMSSSERALKVSTYLTRACTGGVYEACSIAGAGYLEPDTCQKAIDFISKKQSDTYDIVQAFRDQESYCRLMSRSVDNTLALDLINTGCARGDDTACKVEAKIGKLVR